MGWYALQCVIVHVIMCACTCTHVHVLGHYVYMSLLQIIHIVALSITHVHMYRTVPLLHPPPPPPPPFATYFQEKEGGGRNNEDLRFRLAVKPPPP